MTYAIDSGSIVVPSGVASCAAISSASASSRSTDLLGTMSARCAWVTSTLNPESSAISARRSLG